MAHKSPNLQHIQRDIRLGFLGELLLILLLVIGGYIAVSSLHSRLQEVIDVQQHKIQQVTKMRDAIWQRMLALHNMIVIDDAIERDEEWIKFGSYAGQFIAARDELFTMGLGAQEMALIDELRTAVQAAEDNVNATAALASQGLKVAAQSSILQARHLNQDVLSALNKLLEFQNNITDDAIYRANAVYHLAQLGILILGAMVFAFGWMLAVYINAKVKAQHQLTERLFAEVGSAHQQLESEVMKVRNQLQSRIFDLAEARDIAEQANEAKSRFIANVSHELRTPLNAIIGYSELLIEQITDGDLVDHDEDLCRIQSAGIHLLALLNDVLDLCKIEAGKMEICREEFDLKLLMDDIVNTVQPLVKENKNTLQVQYCANLELVIVDKMRLKQVLFNLLSNALKFTCEGSVAVNVTMTSQCLTIDVMDSGIGMSTDQLDRLFEDFTQADVETTHKYGGTGLGLAISRRFCQLMGGDLKIMSELAKGTCATITLPSRLLDE